MPAIDTQLITRELPQLVTKDLPHLITKELPELVTREVPRLVTRDLPQLLSRESSHVGIIMKRAVDHSALETLAVVATCIFGLGGWIKLRALSPGRRKGSRKATFYIALEQSGGLS
ncbi:hypothetical protein F4778DRAFT_778296 [Xylariomycetidae sp. FL2044]|nr:hypothetical protein F4778DRAFT_778296 [Xylariomycetidae sp. FL2044]